MVAPDVDLLPPPTPARHTSCSPVRRSENDTPPIVSRVGLRVKKSPVTNQDANPSLLLATQQDSNVVFNRSLLSKSEDMDLFNKFNIVFNTAKERIFLLS